VPVTPKASSSAAKATTIPLPARVFVVTFAALELAFGVTGTAAGVAHFAHLGGMLGGWLMIQYRRSGFPFRP
jgi:membrane associated rhomboid family serine protease